MKVKKIASINDRGEISNSVPAIAAMVLSTCSGEETSVTDLKLPIAIGQGGQRRTVVLDTPIKNSVLAAQSETPTSLDWPHSFGEYEGEYHALFLFRNQLFLATTPFSDANNEIEATLLVKKLHYSEDNRLKRLKQEVEAMEGVIEQKVSAKRTAIPDAVKLIVYARDDGKCTRCGSVQSLHFDHIIPVTKGGGNSEQNIQILCEYCNLKKSDKIAF